MEVTIWEKQYKDGDWYFNHLEIGYDPTATAPVPKFDTQKGWKTYTWRSKKAQLVDGVVIEDKAG